MSFQVFAEPVYRQLLDCRPFGSLAAPTIQARLTGCRTLFPAGPVTRKRSRCKKQQSGTLGPECTRTRTGKHRNRSAQCDHERQSNSTHEIRSPCNVACDKSAEEGKGKAISHGECFETEGGG